MLEIAVTTFVVSFLLLQLGKRSMSIPTLWSTIPFYKQGIQQWVLVDVTVLLCVCSLLLFLLLLLKHRSLPRLDVLVMWSAVLVIVLIGAIYSPNAAAGTAALEFALLTFLPPLPLLYVGALEKYQRECLATVLVIGLLNLGVGLVVFVTGNFSFRLELPTANTIGAGRSLLLLPIIFVGYRAGLSGGRGWLAVIVSGLATIMAVAAGNRQALLAMLIVVPLIAITDRQHHVRTANALLLGAIFSPALIGGIVLGISRLPEAAVTRILNPVLTLFGLHHAPSVDDSISARFEQWGLAIRMASESPLIGHGTGSFSVWSADGSRFVLEYPHNLFLQALAEYGTIGFSIVLVFTVYCLGLSITSIGISPYALSYIGIAVFLLMNAMFSNSLLDFRMMWMFIIAAACLAPVARRPNRAVPRSLSTGRAQ